MKTVEYESLAKERVRIAKDVIAQLKNNKYEATEGTYCILEGKEGSVFGKEDAGKQLQIILNKKIKSCEVCAMGALFVSMVRKFDQVLIKKCWISEDIIPTGDIFESLKQFFPRQQLKSIEKAFEGWGEGSGESGLAERYRNPTKRMIVIMENIIANKGTYVSAIAELRQIADKNGVDAWDLGFEEGLSPEAKDQAIREYIERFGYVRAKQIIQALKKR